MAVSLTNKANNVSTSNGFSTGSLSWTAGTRGLVFVASACNSSGGVTGHTVTGGGVTWSEIGTIEYALRRRISVLLSSGTPSAGALTITATIAGGVSYQETQWSVDELAGFNTTTVHDTVNAKATAGAPPFSTDDLGTIDAGDLAIIGAGFESGADGFAVQSGTTEHVKRTGGGNVRSLIVGYSTTDDTPGVTWNTTGNGCGLVGFIVNAAAGGSFGDGAGSSSLTFSTSAGGSSLADAAASSSLTFSPSGTGASFRDAAGSTTISFSPAAVGAAFADSSASSSLTFATAAAGSSLFDAAGSSSLTFAASGHYANTIDGVGSSSLAFAASGVASALADGAGASALAFAGSAVGSALVNAAGSSSITFAVAGAGDSESPATPRVFVRRGTTALRIASKP